MSKKRPLNNTIQISILLTLCMVPILYLVILKFLLHELFTNSSALLIFSLYNGAFWVLFMLVTGMEFYRRTITRRISKFRLLYLVIMGSLLIAIVGIAITPVGPELFSQGALKLIATNLLLGTAVGLITGLKSRKGNLPANSSEKLR